ncbi:MAG TPA: flagellar hook-length control protein FliK [Steroidobacteraceae bacterium]|nr:flagellar hook-length control protein FliK [Steroidobacteraceae bacterium]
MLNFVQTLARSINAGQTADAPAAASPSAADVSADDGGSDADAKGAGAGQGDLALALVSQSIAAALGLPAVMPPMAAPSPTGQSTPATSTASGTEAIDGAGAQPASANGSAVQTLVTLIAEDAAAQSKDKTPATGQADATSAPLVNNTATGSADSAPATAAPTIPHLGIASHFSVQHSSPDSNSVGGGLRAQVGTPAWSEELGGQITWMAHQGIESASLQLSPEHLGPLEVHISVHDGAASVWFGATQPDTRAALEQALPRLREMFATQGLTLMDAGVSHESPRNQSKPPRATAPAAVSAVAATESTTTSASGLSLGLVDTYA